MMHDFFPLIALASVFVDFIVAIGVIFYWPAASRVTANDAVVADALRIDLRRILVAVFFTSAAFILKVFALLSVRFSLFGLIHLVFIDLAFLTPLIAAIVLIAGRRRGDRPPRRRLTVPVRFAAVVAISFLPIGLYANLIEPYRLQIERATVPVSGERDGRAPIKVAVLADIQTGSMTDYERRVLELTMAEKPNLILIPGDVFQGSDREFKTVKRDFNAFFRQLHAPMGVYCVMGDVDYVDRFAEMFRGTDVKLLVNDVARIAHGGRRITIIGTELDPDSPHIQRLLSRFKGDGDDGDIRILVAHRPDVATVIPKDVRIDLVVAGHTHGGQVVIPFFGPPITLTHVPRHVAAGGLHEIQGVPIYVSRGIGHERGMAPRIRFFCPPELTFLTLQSSN